MEANKDQALHCRDMGLTALKAGDKNKALRLLEKSQRMYPDDSTKRLILSLNNNNNDNNNNMSQTPPSHNTNSSSSSNPSTSKPHFAAKTHSTSPSGSSTSSSNSNDNNSSSSSSSSSFSSSNPTPTPPIGSASKPSPPDTSTPHSNLRHRAAASANTSGSTGSNTAGSNVPNSSNTTDSKESSNRAGVSTPPSSNASTAEQENLCRRILNTNDHYAVLGVPKNATEEQIKKSYKKLAFQLHPDKNKAPSAEEGFKKISKAFQCLSDSSKRALYDQFGNDDDVPQQYRNEYESDFMSPEELFEAFFGVDLGYGGRRRVYRRVRRPQTRSSEQQQNVGNLIQMLPVLILLAITILSSFFHHQPRPNFEFQRSPSYPVEQRTQRSQVKYFTAPSFASDFPPATNKRHELELEVELIHYSKLCNREQNDKLREIQRATYESKSERERRQKTESIEKEEMINCKKFADLRNQYGRIYGVSRLDSIRF